MTASSTPTPKEQGSGYCSSCGAALSAGARFCHRCGTPRGQATPPGNSSGSGPGYSAQSGSQAASILPWGVAFLALLALVAMFAGRNFGAARGSAVSGSANALPTQAIDGAGPASDISNLSPSDRANRLYQRLMTYVENGDVDSVAFFAPMALAAHEMIENPTPDERYHFGRLAEVSGSSEVVRAQADTILMANPDDLLGLMLAGSAARMEGDTAGADRFDSRLLSALNAQLAVNRDDYQMHRVEIDRAAEGARVAGEAASRR